MHRLSVIQVARPSAPWPTGRKARGRRILGKVFQHNFAALLLGQIPKRIEKGALRLHSIFNGLALFLGHVLQRGFHALAHRGVRLPKKIVGAPGFGGAKTASAAAGGFGMMLHVPGSEGDERQEHHQQNGPFVSEE